MSKLKLAAQKTIPFTDLEDDLPDLESAEELDIDLNDSYWSPDEVGESKRLFFSHIAPRKVLNPNGGGLAEIDCAHFIEVVDGEKVTVVTGGKRLVGAMEKHGVTQGMAFQITYIGEIKNMTNDFDSYNWSIRPLIFK